MVSTRQARVRRAAMSRGWQGRASLAGLLAAVIAWPALGQDDVDGRWDPPEGGYNWEVNAEHAVHLSTGKILVWQNGNSARLWNPGDGGFTDVANEEHNVGCAGLTALANGSILVAGGGGEETPATNQTSVFSLGPVPLSGPWEEVGLMYIERWYPTCTTLPDGRVLGIGGRDAPFNQGGLLVPKPQVYDPDSELWDPELPEQPEDTRKTYPFMFLLPDGTVFFAGPSVPTYTFDVLMNSWEFVGNSHFSGGSGSASAVTYEPGLVLKCGGNGGDRTDVINFILGTGWVEVNAMEQVRRRHNLVLLPDGKILAIDGEQENPPGSGNFVPVLPAELFDPVFETWEEMAAMTRPRARHSTAVLLPDGKVLACGGNPDFDGHPTSESGEIFSPPYLFWGERPVIGLAPTVIRYGTSFRVMLSAPAAPPPIGTVSLLRLAAVTHSFDQNQRYVPLTFTMPFENRLDVDAPANANQAPPGYYMLFVVSEDGVPSVATYVRLE